MHHNSLPLASLQPYTTVVYNPNQPGNTSSRWLFSIPILLLFFILPLSSFAQTWVQKGADIDGPPSIAWLGYAVSLSADGSTVAAGGPYHNSVGVQGGYVQVFTWDGNAWNQKGSDINGEAPGNWSGYSISLSGDGNILAIGAPFNSGSASRSGHTRVYEWNGTAWVQRGPDIDGEAADDNSGWAVKLSDDGNTVAIGATGNDGTGPIAGHVRVYDWDGVAWTQKGADIDGKAPGDQSGYTIGMSADGNTVAIGSPFNDGNGTDAGMVRVYSWDGTNWIKQGADINGDAAGDEAGYSVSLSADGNTLVIGAPRNDANGAQAGHARVYFWNGTSWVQKGLDIEGHVAGMQTGYSVSINASGDTVAVSAPFSNFTVTDVGLVRVYEWNGSSWSQLATDMYGEGGGDELGYSISLSADGSSVAAGAPFNNGNGSDAGHVRVYDLSCNGYSTMPIAACFTYTVPSGNQTYTTSGTYLDTIPNWLGCDSVITILLTVRTVDVSVTASTTTLTANSIGTYQWLDCDNNLAPVSGATERTFKPDVNGSYAVAITRIGCTDTSACYDITAAGIFSNNLDPGLSAYPNPTIGSLFLDLGQTYRDVTVTVKNMTGQLVYSATYEQADKITTQLKGPSGMYVVEITTPKGQSATLKVLKE